MTDSKLESRRNALSCMAYGGAGTLFVLAGGVLTPIDLAEASQDGAALRKLGKPLFVQISDTHIGFNKDANPGRQRHAHAEHRAGERAARAAGAHHPHRRHHASVEGGRIRYGAAVAGQLKVTELHTVPGEHDITDPEVSEYFTRFGKASDNRGYYSFDHAGVHFIALVNVLQFKPGGLGTLGAEQLAWVAADLKGRSASTPIVVFAHMPLWTIYEPWGWGTGDADQLHGLTAPLRFGHGTERPHPSDRPEG